MMQLTRITSAVSPQCFGNGIVRLVGGADTNEGRVEVCVNGMWGTVYGYGWDSRDVKVVCKQLGYQNPCKSTTYIMAIPVMHRCVYFLKVFSNRLSQGNLATIGAIL